MECFFCYWIHQFSNIGVEKLEDTGSSVRACLLSATVHIFVALLIEEMRITYIICISSVRKKPGGYCSSR